MLYCARRSRMAAMAAMASSHPSPHPPPAQTAVHTLGKYDEDAGVLTRQQLYASENGDQVYYIIRSRGRDERTRHAYRLQVRGDLCVINNGRSEMTLNFDMLMLAVRGLCGLSEDAVPSLEMVEEMLRAANA